MSSKPSAINILLLGQTGVGKSTWINAFANYCKFATLSEARDAGGLFPIPTVFHVTDPISRVRRTISTHPDRDLSAFTPAGQSVTHDPEEHIFGVGHFVINLIDTPGLLSTGDYGDVTSCSSDRCIVDNTFSVLSMYEEIHAIFVFIKATEARINQPFIYCLTEIFRRLHRSACDNVVFIFTYAAGACFSSDTTEPVLEHFLRKYKVPINPPLPIFCFENSTVKNIVEHKNGIVDRKNDDSNENNWRFSAETLEACMKHTLSLKPHPIASTVSVHWAICMISKLFGLLTDTVKCINTDISSAHEQQKRAEDLKQQINLSEHPEESLLTCLRDSCYITETKLNIEKSGYINVVCESRMCINRAVSDDREVFSQICFKGLTDSLHACVSNLVWFEDPNTGKRVCRECECARKCHHMRWFKVRYVTEQLRLTDVVTEIRSSKDALEYLNEIISAFKDRATELQSEEEEILQACAELITFMKQNALIEGESQTDSDQRNLLHILDTEIAKYTFGTTQLMNQRRDKLQEMKEKFEKQLEAHHKDTRVISADDVKGLIERLYGFPHKGSQLKEAVDDVKEAWQKLKEEAEGRRQHIDLNDSALLSQVVSQVCNCPGRAPNHQPVYYCTSL